MPEYQFVEIDAAAEIRGSSKSARRKVAKEVRRAAADLRHNQADNFSVSPDKTSGFESRSYRCERF